jgi:hypothetical protein
MLVTQQKRKCGYEFYLRKTSILPYLVIKKDPGSDLLNRIVPFLNFVEFSIRSAERVYSPSFLLLALLQVNKNKSLYM